MLIALGDSCLTHLGADVRVPTYDRSALTPSVVHIGVGGFHRSHLATYIHELCTLGHTEWAIVGSGVLAGDATMADALAAQDCLYTLITRGPQSTDVAVIGSIVDYVYAHAEPDRLVAAIASPTTQLISLTVTEGGYPVDDSTGDFQPHSSNAGPSSTFGLIVAGLEFRRQAGVGAVTVMSCDNIMENGSAARTATLGEAARVSDELAAWVESSVSFPNSMVDRITPATSVSDREWLADNHGIEDRWPVVAEPFRQWVIEDDFAGKRPPLEELDIIVTDDVQPYEFMKLRLLNAGHSCLAYLAALDGIESVDAAMADPAIGSFVSAFLHAEAQPVLPAVAGVDVDAYIESLIERFSNPQIGDQISRLCLDGSVKFPKFLLPTVRAQINADGPVALSALALAGWCSYLNGRTDRGEVIDLASDPQLDQAVAYAAESILQPSAFLKFSEVFDAEVAGSASFEAAFVEALAVLRSSGIRPAIDAALA